MKKIIQSSVIVLLLLLCGCQKHATTFVAVLMNDTTDSGMIVFFDENKNVLKEVKTVYPLEIYCEDEWLYLSDDGETYSKYNVYTFKKAKGLEKMEDTILSLSKDLGYFSSSNDAFCRYEPDGTSECQQMYVGTYYNDDAYFYVIDNNGILYTYNRETREFLNSDDASLLIQNSDFVGLTAIDQKAYLVTSKGYSAIEKGKITTTYVFPVVFDEIINISANHIYVYQQGESVVYKVSFATNKLLLELELEEKYYLDIDLDSLLVDYFNQDYYCTYFYGVYE